MFSRNNNEKAKILKKTDLNFYIDFVFSYFIWFFLDWDICLVNFFPKKRICIDLIYIVPETMKFGIYCLVHCTLKGWQYA